MTARHRPSRIFVLSLLFLFSHKPHSWYLDSSVPLLTASHPQQYLMDGFHGNDMAATQKRL